MLMLILIDDDFPHLYIPTEEIDNVLIFFPLPINKKSKMATTDKQRSGSHYIIANN